MVVNQETTAGSASHATRTYCICRSHSLRRPKANLPSFISDNDAPRPMLWASTHSDHPLDLPEGRSAGDKNMSQRCRYMACAKHQRRSAKTDVRLVVVAYTAMVLLCGGCALRHGDYALEGKVRVELSPPSGPLIYGIQIEQSSRELVVSGFGRRPTADGYVEIFLISPDGALLAQVQAELLPPLPVPNRTYNYRFSASVPLIPPADSTLRVVYAEATDTKRPSHSRRRQSHRCAWSRRL